ncbi:MAG: Nif3-like dinuclear metal center hexameric protein [Bacteroidetes bacterium]|nr:MAG: Nif3-like dinuclear metal center hexameric protein [Bacteroidota bacterium]
MSTKVRHIINFMHQWAPPEVKMDYDNVGLIVGDPDADVTSVLVCLDLTENVVDEAIQSGCDTILSHHPLIFRKLSRINPDHEQGRIIYKLIQNNISYLCAHTNLDLALDGVSFVLANLLGLDQPEFLSKEVFSSRKITLTADTNQPERILSLLNYHSAEHAFWFDVDGRANGAKRFEAIIDRHHLGHLTSALKKEGLLTPGRFQVTAPEGPSDNFGLGVIGSYPDGGIPREEFLYLVCQALQVPALRTSGHPKTIRKVAVCGGAGISLKNKALAAGADAFVTADIKYHDYFHENDQFLLVDAGHYETEFPVVDAIRRELSEAFEQVRVSITSTVTNPMEIFITEIE